LSTYRPAEARVRETLLDLWAQSRGDWRFVTERLSQAFRNAKHLHSAERRIVAETLYGMVRYARTIDYVLAGAGVETPTYSPSHEPTRERAWLDLLVYRMLFEGLGIDQAKAERPDVDWPAVWRTFSNIERLADTKLRFALQYSLPDWLAERLLAELGERDAAAFANALNARAPLTLRANRLKGTREALIALLHQEDLQPQPTKWAPDGVVLAERVNVFGLPGFKAGLFEVQDEASQLCAELIAPPVHGLVVDACAGAGGKTLALGAIMRNKGRLVAMDMAKHKLDELGRRARRAGLSNHRTIVLDPDGPLPPETKSLVGKADRVFVDAPCSGVGSMRRNPEARWRMSPDFVAALPELQLRIALRVLPLLKPGGRFVYATCTTLSAENEAVVAKIMEHDPRLQRIAVKEILGKARAEGITSADGFSIRTTPDVHGMDGFYATALRLGTAAEGDTAGLPE
jgi:16S rRNA (cytosine967-C5)-methyltransferase